MILSAFIFVVVVFCEKLTLEPSNTPLYVQKNAVSDLIGRTIGTKYINLFTLEIDEKYENYFELSQNSGKIHVKSATGIGLSSGFFYYLKHYTNSSVTWQTRNIDFNFPLPPTTVTKKNLVRYRYIFNTCTFGYTLAPWSWDEWERLIDWMALHGINLPLSFVGQELVWMKTFMDFGLTKEQMFDYFAGPHFLPWFRMGNIRKWGGPMSEQFLNNQADLQKKILARERSFGMQPVLPGFAGFIPDGFVKKYPNGSYTRSSKWAGFNETYSENYMIDPSDELFLKIGESFMGHLIDEFGTDHIYNCDTFNEMKPKSKDPNYLRSVSKGVYQAMTNVDDKAVWMLQGWSFWGDGEIAAYLSPVPNDRMIILDLFSEEYPVFKYHHSYFGKPFVWCLLKNFGGRRGLYGDYEKFTTNPISDFKLPNVTMEGLGITSEAIYMPPVMYEVFADLFLYQNPFTDDDRVEWLKNYLSGRYGTGVIDNKNLQSSWEYMIDGAYSFYPADHKKDARSISTFDDFPNIDMKFTTNRTYITKNAVAYRFFYKSIQEISKFTDGYLYDLVDLTRQILSDLFTECYNVFYIIFKNKNHDHKKVYADLMLDILVDLDAILLTNENFLLGTWIEDSRALGTSDKEKDLFEYNARNQLTLWGPDGQINDYAKKHWSGLVGDYYHQRWKNFFKFALLDDFNKTEYIKEQIVFEKSFNFDKKKYPIKPEGDIKELEKKIFEKYCEVDLEKDFQKFPDTDVLVVEDIAQTITMDIVTIARICKFDDFCKGFSSDGYLKSGVSGKVAKQGIDLYVKK